MQFGNFMQFTSIKCLLRQQHTLSMICSKIHNSLSKIYDHIIHDLISIQQMRSFQITKALDGQITSNQSFQNIYKHLPQSTIFMQNLMDNLKKSQRTNQNSSQILLQYILSSTMEVQKHILLQYFESYPQILKGLTTHLNVSHLTDFQQQLLSLELEEQQISNMLISAPTESGKLLGIILFIVRKFIDLEEQRVLIIAHSKQLSQNITTIISSLCKSMILNMFMLNGNNHQYSAKGSSVLPAKCFVIASPLQVQTLSKQNKTKITQLVIVQSQLLLSFGYKQSLYRCMDTFEKLGQQISIIVVYCSTPGEKNVEIEEFKQNYLAKNPEKKHRNKLVKIDYLPPEVLNQIKFEQSQKASMHHKIDTQAAHFYHSGQKISLPICLYVTLKFNLVNPKVLILVKNLQEAYRYFLFLQRTKIPNIGVYNHQNPINLKFYNLQLWMGGNIDVMIATNALIQDLQNNIFQDNIKRAKKKGRKFGNFQLKNLCTVVCMNLSHIRSSQEQEISHQNEGYDNIFELFQVKPFIMTFIENTEQQISQLHKFIKALQHKFTVTRSKELPIPHEQLQAFKYRINDVFSSLGKSKVDLFMQMDLKKKILRSPDMKQHFQNVPKQKEVLIKSINQIHHKLQQDKVTITEIVPSYLVPQCLRQSYQQQVKNLKQIQKATKQSENTPQYQQKINNVLRHIDLKEQQPQITDISRLKLVSARKRWKLQHGFKLKKKNFRKEKKGIFDSS